MSAVTVYAAQAAHFILPVVALIVLIRCVASMFYGRAEPETWGHLVTPDGKVYPLLHWECLIGRARSADITLPFADVANVHAVLAVVTGVVFARQMLAPGERENDAGALVCASMPMVLLVFWLIVSYKVNIINPTISAYAVEILALCAALIAFYELAGFAYGRPKAVKSIFWSQFAAFLCITALPDDRAGAQQLMLVAVAGMLLFQSYLTASNIRPAVSGPAGGAQ